MALAEGARKLPPQDFPPGAVNFCIGKPNKSLHSNSGRYYVTFRFRGGAPKLLLRDFVVFHSVMKYTVGDGQVRAHAAEAGLLIAGLRQTLLYLSLAVSA